MCIQPTGDERYLPVAHTCFNGKQITHIRTISMYINNYYLIILITIYVTFPVLDLPKYQTKERLKYKVLQAIQHNEGFSLV